MTSRRGLRLLEEVPAAPRAGQRRGEAPNLFVVRSLVQMGNAIEAAESYGLRDRENWLLLAFRNDAQMAMHRAILATWPHFSRIVWHRGRQLPAFLRVFSRVRRFDWLVIGDWTQLLNFFLNRIASFRHTIVVDDGVASLHRLELMAAGRLPPSNRRTLTERRWLARLQRRVGLCPSYVENAQLFIQYEVPEALRPHHRLNDYPHLRSLLAEMPVGDERWFIGNAYRYHALREPASQLALMARVDAHRSLKGVVYVPHPKEESAVTNELCETFGMRPWRPVAPIEFELLRRDRRPAMVMSFGSSAVDALARLCGAPVTIYRIPDALLFEAATRRTTPMYERYAELGYEIVRLNGTSPLHRRQAHATQA
jgi:hypothetical protein